MSNLLAFLLFTVLLCWCPRQAGAQSITGNVSNLKFLVVDSASRRPLGGVSCRVLTRAGRLYKYGVSASDGRLALVVNRTDVLEFSFIGYSKKRMKSGELSGVDENVVELSSKDVVLKEVRVRVPPIKAQGDTLIYNVAAFRSAGDRHLEDILRKLPGVKVGENGAISVQGQAINKFYIEGMDLMGNSYSEATRNMPVDAVKSVEVLENHQPVKLLRNKAFSDKAALNIKLDNRHKSRPFGEMEAGIGVRPSVWDVRLFLSQIMKRNQLLVSGKTNNVGTDLSSETEEHIDVTDVDAYMPLPTPLLSSGREQEVLPPNRYINNKSYSAGINFLTKITDNSTFRTNVRFFGDHSTSGRNYDNVYGGKEPVQIREVRQIKRNTLTLVPVLKYELNSPHTFFTNELRYSFSRSAYMNSVYTGGSTVNERIHTRPDYFQNYLNTSFNIGENIVSVKSFTRYFRRNEGLDVQVDNPSEAYYTVAENPAARSLMARNMFSTSFPVFGNMLNFGLWAFYRNNSYDYAGNARHKKLELSFRPSYTLKYGSDNNINLSLPVVWTDVSLTLPSVERGKRSYWFLSPELYAGHRFSETFKLFLTASIQASDAMSPFYANDTLRTGYRTLYIPSNVIFKNISRRVSLRLRYRDYVSMFFATLAASYSDIQRESYTDYTYTGLFSTSRETAGRNHQRMLLVNADADKSFASAGLTLKSGLSYNLNSFLLSQNSVVTENKSNVLSAALTATFQKLRWLKIIAGSRGNLYWERSSISHSNVLTSLSSDMSVYLFPVKKLEMRLKFENLTNEISPSRYKSSTFLDGSLRYIFNKIWEVSLTATNLLNVRSFTIVTNSGLNTFTSVLPLTGRKVLLHLQFRF